MAFELLQERHGGVLVIAPRGRLDNDSASDFELAAQELLAAGEQHLVVDLAQLNYVSNAGLRVLGMLGKALKSPATSLRLCGLTPAVRQVFDAAGVSVMFDVRPDLARALADHPAARGAGELVQHASRLLGVGGAQSEPPGSAADVGNLARLANELLAGAGAQPRAARAMAAGTQMVPRVRAEDVARAQAQSDAASGKKASWLQRLLGKR
jgi:stage II sporulation protein AA (anti-sigma F factor antagonist)